MDFPFSGKCITLPFCRFLKHYGLFALTVFYLLPIGVLAAPPSASTYRDALRIHQNTTFTSDWSGTLAFAIESPVDVQAEVVELEFPGDERMGYVLLHFQLIPSHELSEIDRAFYEQTHVAIMQTPDAFSAVDIGDRDLARGSEVGLRLWLATPQNYLPYKFLVESVTLAEGNIRIGLHDDNEALQARMTGSRVGVAK